MEGLRLCESARDEVDSSWMRRFVELELDEEGLDEEEDEDLEGLVEEEEDFLETDDIVLFFVVGLA